MPTRPQPTGFLRNLGQLLDQLVEPKQPGERARIAAQGAVAGISEQVQASVPELHAEAVERFVVNLVFVLDHLVGEAAQHLQAGEAGYLAQHLAEGVVRGLVGELKATTPELREGLGRVVEKLQSELDQLIQERQAERLPGEQGYRARVMGEGAVRGAASELKRQLPEIEQGLRALGPAGRQVASQFVRQAVGSLVENAGELVAAVELVSESASRKAVQGIVAELEVQMRRAKSEGAPDAAAAALERRLGQAAEAIVRGALDAMAEEARRRQLGPRAREALARVGRAGADGALAAVGERLRRPLLWTAGVGAALGLALLTRRAWTRA